MTIATSAACVLISLLSQTDAKAEAGDRHLGKLVESTSPSQYAEQLAEIMVRADTGKLDELSRDSRHGVAFAAQWARIINAAKRNKNKLNRPDIDFELARFIGIVEGRLKITVPPGWLAMLRSSSPDLNGDDFMFWKYSDNARLPSPLKTVRLREQLTVRADGKVFSVPCLTPYTQGAPASATVLSTETRHYAAFYDWPPRAYKLYAFEPEKTSLVWSNVVWADSNTDYQGSGFHNVEMVASSESIYVFGSSYSALYIEAFSPTTGESQWRFSNVYFESLEYRIKAKR